jgi:hypothetical protein
VNALDDPAKLLAENTLLRLLMQLPQGICGMLVETRVGNIAATLHIGDVNKRVTLTPRKQQILEVVRRLFAREGRRVTGAEIRTEMQANGVEWSGSTINTSLADLVADGFLVNRNDKLGYGVAELPGSLAASNPASSIPDTKGQS